MVYNRRMPTKLNGNRFQSSLDLFLIPIYLIWKGRHKKRKSRRLLLKSRRELVKIRQLFEN